jgi:hypothetical protein
MGTGWLTIQHANPSDRAVQGCGYIGARTDTTQRSGQTPDKELEITHITVYISGYAETDPTGMLSLGPKRQKLP